MAKSEIKSAYFEGDPESLREWQKRMGFSYETAANALNIGRTTYAEMVLGESRIDLRTSLACAAIEQSIKPIIRRKKISKV
jgi:hypothetical protein